MSHMPFARRYRPQNFQDVLGQEQTVSALRNSLTHKKTAHAYLFCGTRGCGKTTLARLLAKALNCESLNEKAESCNRCSSCVSIQTSSHLDVIEIDGASHRGIDDIRQINETVGFQPSVGRFKVFIIDEVHMLTKEAFNALLKTLEEPPATVKFIFATTEPHKVPATILSRCLRFQLKRIPILVIQKRLSEILEIEKVPFEEEALVEIAARAEGSLRDSLSLLDQALAFQPEKVSYQALQELLGLTTLEVIQQYETCLASGDGAMALQFVQTVLETGMETSYLIEQLQLHTRLLLSVRVKAPVDELVPSKRAFYEKLAFSYSEQDLVFILDFLNQALLQSKQYLQPKLHLEVMMLHLIRKPWLFSLDHLMKRLSELENRLQSPSAILSSSSLLSETKEPIENTNKTSPTLTSARDPLKAEFLSRAPLQASPELLKTDPSARSPLQASSSELLKADPSTRSSLQASPDLFQAPSLARTAMAPPLPATSKTALSSNEPRKTSSHSPNSSEPPSSPHPLAQMPSGRYEGLIHFAAKELGGHLR